MNPLRHILQSLKSPPSKSWNLIIMPDPRRYRLKRIGSTDGFFEFYMRLDGNMNMRRYISRNPLFTFAPNTSSCMKLAPHNQLILTEWIKITTKYQQTPTKPTLHKALAKLLDAFPYYKLQSEEGIGAAIREIEDQLSVVASFEPNDASQSPPPHNEEA
ncbi:hypothetical protein BYT27DRAFT_7245465 [Phlegmacium glaucopus]|nr:hypothetical protein BYT27DRAFT_7245465 [Phlegmacium glaucopus]